MFILCLKICISHLKVVPLYITFSGTCKTGVILDGAAREGRAFFVLVNQC